MLSFLLFVVVAVQTAAAVALRRRLPRWAVAALLGAALAAAAAWIGLCGVYDLRKLVGVCLMPVGIVWMVLFLVAWILTEQRRHAMAACAWLLWVGLTVSGNGWIGGSLVRLVEAPFRGIDPFDGPSLDAVVVLGGGVGRGPSGGPVLGRAGDRAILGARLYRAGRTSQLVTTGPVVGEGATSVPRLTAGLWTDLGVQVDDIVQVVGPRTTAAEMDAIADLIARTGWRKVGVVTSGYHMRRALKLALRRGLDIEPLPADLSAPPDAPAPAGLVPNAGGFGSVHTACWEILGALASR